MSHIRDLRNLSEEDHDEELFLKAVDEAFQEWKKNELYKERIQRDDVPDTIESFEDIKKLPTVDMREFKEHPRELVIDEDEVDEEYALYSSGTTSDSKSFTLRSEEGYRRHRENFEKFIRYLVPELSHVHVMSAPKQMLEKLPEEQAKRAVFNYPIWIYEQFDNDFYLEKTEEGMKPDVDAMIKNIKQTDGNQAVFSTPNNLYKVVKKLSEEGVSADLGPEGVIMTAGGWKGASGANKEEFRELLNEVFNVSPQNHLDFYGCTELFFATGNKFGDENPDKKRVPPEGYIWIADEEEFLSEGVLKPVEEGEPGLLVAVDPSNTDYPGVILTDDVVRKTGGEYGQDVRIEYVGRSSM